jgi:hypothetical protein
MTRNSILAFAGVVAAGVASLLYLDPLLRLALLNSTGYVSEGEFAGIRIGSSRKFASQALLSRGLRRHEVRQGGQCLMRTYGSDTTIDIFRDPGRFVRRGTVCVATADGAVSEVSWFYGGP